MIIERGPQASNGGAGDEPARGAVCRVGHEVVGATSVRAALCELEGREPFELETLRAVLAEMGGTDSP